MTIDDCNSLLYQALSTASLGISGDIYFDNERPVDSTKEDIAINTPSLTGGNGHPQNGYSNINIYVPVKKIKTTDGYRTVRNRTRERELVNKVSGVIENMSVEGVNYIDSENKEQSVDGRETFCNVRVFWKIYVL